jgi:hypothetical protein
VLAQVIKGALDDLSQVEAICSQAQAARSPDAPPMPPM